MPLSKGDLGKLDALSATNSWSWGDRVEVLNNGARVVDDKKAGAAKGRRQNRARERTTFFML